MRWQVGPHYSLNIFRVFASVGSVTIAADSYIFNALYSYLICVNMTRCELVSPASLVSGQVSGAWIVLFGLTIYISLCAAVHNCTCILN